MASSNREQFIEEVAEAAMDQMRLHGIPASITIAQAIIESGDGKSRLAQTANNLFGVKGDYHGAYVLADDDKPNEHFKKYDNVSQSFEDHSAVLLKERYQSRVGHLGLDDYEGWARGIAAGGYATAPKYAETVIGVIKASNLQKYDQMVIEQMKQEGRNVVTKADVGVAQDPKRAATGFSLPLGQYSMPVQRSEYMLITSAYGERKDPMDRSKTQFHRGIDIKTRGDAVLATEDNGRIVMVNQNVNTGGGKSITVAHSREYGTKTYAEYMHLSKIDVKVGDTVNAGQQLGVSGNTGTRTTGEHLHFGIYVSDANGKRNYVDPAAYLAEIRDKGNLQVEARLSNGKELLAQYQPSERHDAGQPEETDKEQKQDKGEQKEMNPVQWFAKLFGSPDSALGYGGGGIIDSLVSMLMSLLLLTFALDNKKSNEEKMQSVTDALIQKKVDLSALTPNLKSSELSVKENGTSVLTTNDGKNEYSHTLTKAETDNILSIVKSDADAETKAQRLGTIISAVTYSQAASQSYEQMMEQQRSQEQSLQRK